MCLPRIGEILELDGTRAVVDLGTMRSQIDVMCLPDARAGDHVMIHAGFAIARLTPEEAAERRGLIDTVRFGEEPR